MACGGSCRSALKASASAAISDTPAAKPSMPCDEIDCIGHPADPKDRRDDRQPGADVVEVDLLDERELEGGQDDAARLIRPG